MITVEKVKNPSFTTISWVNEKDCKERIIVLRGLKDYVGNEANLSIHAATNRGNGWYVWVGEFSPSFPTLKGLFDYLKDKIIKTTYGDGSWSYNIRINKSK